MPSPTPPLDHPPADQRPMPLSPHDRPRIDRDRSSLVQEQQASAALWLVVLVTAALGLRLLIFALGPMGDLSRAMSEDSPRYLSLAHQLAREHVFALSPADDTGPAALLHQARLDAGELPNQSPTAPILRPETYRTPGYPAFLAAFQTLGLGGRSVLLVQCLLGALCVIPAYRLTLAMLGSPNAALVAAAVTALHPAAVASTNVLLPEVLWMMLLLTGGWMIASTTASNPTGSAAIGGTLLGLAALVEPYALGLLALPAAWLCLRHRRPTAVGAAIVMLVMAAIPVGTWIGRNHALGQGAILSSQAPVDRYFFHVPADAISPAVQHDDPAPPAARIAHLLDQRRDGETLLAAMNRLAEDATGSPSGRFPDTLRHGATRLVTDHSLDALYRQLGIAYQAPPVRTAVLTHGLDWRQYPDTGDEATWVAAMLWTLINALLLLACVVGLIVMPLRAQILAPLLLTGLIGWMMVDPAGGLARSPWAGPTFQAMLAAGLFLPARWRPRRVKKSREEKQLDKIRRRQRQAIGVREEVSELTDGHDPIIPGQGPRHSARPI